MPQAAGLDALAPPPRTVPARLRRQLWAGTGLCVASVLFGVALPFAVLFANPVEFTAATLLLISSREAPATVRGSENTKWEENNTPVFCHRYSFTLPDGQIREGRSYTTGPKKLPKQAMVHYHPEQPWANALDGTRPTRFGWLVLLVYLFPAIALLVAISFVYGIRTSIHLLAHGVVGQATLVSCVVRRDEPTDTMPFAEYRAKWLASRETAVAERTDSGNAPGPALAGGLFSCFTVVILGFGLVILLVMLALLWLADMPFNVNGRPVGRGVATLVLIGFMAMWCAMGYGLVWFGRWAANRNTAAGPVGEQVEVEFQFTLPGGETRTCRQALDFSERLGDEPTEPVLYDPNKPDKALLLDGICPRVVVTPMGGWDTAQQRRTFLRGLVVVASLVGGPVLSGFLAHWMS